MLGLVDTFCVKRHGEYELKWKCPCCGADVSKLYESKDVAEKAELGILEGWLNALCSECLNAQR